jgi:catechol 2,3-dioxygenase-like lactoylglutathione lyase family enzyme
VTASIEITVDAVEATLVAAFWREALGYRLLSERDPYAVLGPPPNDARPRVVIQRVGSAAGRVPRVHLDLRVDDPAAEVARLRGLGAVSRWEVDERARGGSRWTTMADPQGTLFCVCPAREG